MKINKLISNFNHTPGSIGRIKYIVIHYTGSASDAEANAKYFAGGNRKASAHYFVGYKGDIWQSVEDNNIAWHCGASKYKHPECRNSNSIGIELCAKTKGSTEKADQNWYFEDATAASGIALTKELMAKYGIGPDRVIRHYDVTGKTCPAPYVFNSGKHTWEQFKSAITEGRSAMNEPKVIWEFLTKTCGLNYYAASGIMGNLHAESGLKPNNLQNGFEKSLGMDDATYTAAVDSGAYSKASFTRDKAGYGLAQWTYWTRKQALYDYAKTKKTSIGDLFMQLEFFWREVRSKKDLLDALVNAKSIKEASDAMLHIYEKPKDQSQAVENKRASFGQIYYDQFAVAVKKPAAVPEKPVKENTGDGFLVKVEVPYLNIRSGAGSNAGKTGEYTGVGTFTIVEVKPGEGSKNGWGKLKSGKGWISLDYAKRV